MAIRLFAPKESISKIALALAVIAASILIWMIFDTAFAKGVGVLGKLMVGLVGTSAGVATLLINPSFKWPPSHWRDVFTPASVASVMLALFAGISAMQAVQNMLTPKPAVESAPQIIENTTRETKAGVDDVKKTLAERLPAAPLRAAALDLVPGLWCEPDGEVVWQMELTPKAFRAKTLKPASGEAPANLVSSVTRMDGREFWIVGERPETAKGMAANFRVDDSAEVHVLYWDDKSRDQPTKLVRCERANP
jgi:hypothetical protein